jgi:exodeoxyribonuclease VII large subunit
LPPGALRQKSPSSGDVHGPVWGVGALLQAMTQTLESRFNPVNVQGEISGFSRASSGHCYFTLKDSSGQAQLRCAMFRRAAMAIGFEPADGDHVELMAKVGVYEARGDLQLIVEDMRRAGQGALFEQFLRLKTQLEGEGLFESGRKRDIPAHPRGIGLVTSLGAAALQDVSTALQRRVPHIPVHLAPASVQGAASVPELVQALHTLYDGVASGSIQMDVILLVRGGGSMEDLWSFNAEALVRTVVQSPVPIITGVGHETDFTLVDFAADLRAPTPTAAAELCASPREELLQELDAMNRRLGELVWARLERQQQTLDGCAQALARPSLPLERASAGLQQRQLRLGQALASAGQKQERRLQACVWRLRGLDPSLVLQRGYAWLKDSHGQPVTQALAMAEGQSVTAVLADGEVDLAVRAVRQISPPTIGV